MTTTAPTTHAFALQSGSAPLALHDGPVVVGARAEQDSHVMRAGAIVARKLGRTAVVVSVVDPAQMFGWEPGFGAFPVPMVEALSRGRQRAIEREMAQAHVHAVAPDVTLGDTSEVLARAGEVHEAALIVMGIGRHRPVDRLLGTEIALRVARRASCPILAVTPAFDHAPSVVVVGVDFSETGWHAAACALPLLAPNAVLHLVHVWQPGDLGDEEHVERDDRYRRSLTARFHIFSESLDLPEGITVQHEVQEGNVSKRLADAALIHGADLLVVGRHGRGWADRLRIGSVAMNLLRGAHCAVIVVPELPPHLRSRTPVVHGHIGVRIPREDWAVELDAFARRHAGRIVVLEASDTESGAFTQERGYVLFGTGYDPALGQIEIILGETDGRRSHQTSVFRATRGVAIVRDASGVDLALRIEDGSRTALLTLQHLSPSTDRVGEPLR